MKNGIIDMEISKNHKTRLSVSMQVFENTISEVEGVIENSHQQKTLTETVDNLSPFEKAVILRRIEEVRELIKYVAQQLNLEKRRDETKKQILGTMTIQLVNLEEIRPKRLRGYGEVPEELREFLGPQIDKMMRLVKEICKIANSKDKDYETQGQKP
ncbi:MAG TPA: hypothetical protein VHT73_00610 [Thermodesulfobacteriota bacterium]|nr:hypothetical protein [Thermodesulfobacteriota bacterium]